MGININDLNTSEVSLLFDNESFLDNIRDLSTEELKVSGGGGKGYGGGHSGGRGRKGYGGGHSGGGYSYSYSGSHSGGRGRKGYGGGHSGGGYSYSYSGGHGKGYW